MPEQGLQPEDFRCTIFSTREDFVPALLILAILDPLIEIDGPEEHWRTIQMFNATGKLRFTSMTPADGAAFDEMMSGMQAMFAAVETEAIDQRNRFMETLHNCRLAIGVVGEPLGSRSDQLKAVIGLESVLDGLIFTGSQMGDCHGNVVLDTSGYSGPPQP